MSSFRASRRYLLQSLYVLRLSHVLCDMVVLVFIVKVKVARVAIIVVDRSAVHAY